MGYLLPSEAVGASFTVTAGCVCLLGIITMTPLCFRGKERCVAAAEQEKSYTLREMFRYLGRNKYLLIYFGGYCVYAIGNTATAVLQFASFYLFNSAMLATVIAALNFIPAIVVGLVMPRLMRRWSKFQLLIASMVGYTLFGFVIWLAGYESLTVHLVLSVFRGAFLGGMSVLQFMFTPDCAEYGQYKTGTEAKGITFAVQTFSVKLTGALSSSLALAILALAGWQSVSAESFEQLAALGVQQSAGAINALWFTYALMPALAGALSLLVWRFYRLRDGDVQRMASFNSGEITRAECEAGLSRKL